MAPFSDTGAEIELYSKRHRSMAIIRRIPEGQYQDTASLPNFILLFPLTATVY